MSAGLLVFTKPTTGAFCLPGRPKRALRLEKLMNEEKAMQKEQFLRETERQLRMTQVEAALESDNLIHASWSGKPLCTVDANGTVRFSPNDNQMIFVIDLCVWFDALPIKAEFFFHAVMVTLNQALMKKTGPKSQARPTQNDRTWKFLFQNAVLKKKESDCQVRIVAGAGKRRYK